MISVTQIYEYIIQNLPTDVRVTLTNKTLWFGKGQILADIRLHFGPYVFHLKVYKRIQYFSNSNVEATHVIMSNECGIHD